LDGRCGGDGWHCWAIIVDFELSWWVDFVDYVLFILFLFDVLWCFVVRFRWVFAKFSTFIDLYIDGWGAGIKKISDFESRLNLIKLFNEWLNILKMVGFVEILWFLVKIKFGYLLGFIFWSWEVVICYFYFSCAGGCVIDANGEI
jgi:hypothetical protein